MFRLYDASKINTNINKVEDKYNNDTQNHLDENEYEDMINSELDDENIYEDNTTILPTRSEIRKIINTNLENNDENFDLVNDKLDDDIYYDRDDNNEEPYIQNFQENDDESHGDYSIDNNDDPSDLHEESYQYSLGI